MTMIPALYLASCIALVALPIAVCAQDDDHTITNGSGQTYLAPNGGNASAVDGFTVGTTPSTAATLVVDGSQMANQSIEQFRTIGYYNSGTSTEMETNWRMFRLTSSTPREMGRIFAANSVSGGGNFNFNVQQMVQGGSLWLRNQSNDGIRVIDNASNAPSFVFNGVTNSGNRFGMIAVGLATGIGNAGAPWSRLHLVHNFNGDNQAGFRSFMRNGVTFSGNDDVMYVGQKHTFTGSTEVNDETDALFAWFDDALPVGSTSTHNNATFRFLTTPNASNVGSAGGTEGLEMLRLRPFRSASNAAIQGYVGIGDWAAGSNLPEERLDVLDGNIRFRALPNGTATTDDKMVVVDANGVLHWRSVNGALGSGDCKWTLLPGSGTNLDIATAYSGNPGCPQDDRNVGIGTPTMDGKLHVYKQLNSGTLNAGRFIMDGTASKTCVYAEAGGSGTAQYAINTRASGADGVGSDNTGVIGWALDLTTTSTGRNRGLHGHAQLGSGSDISGSALVNVGVDALSEATVNSTFTENFALYASGTSAATNGANYGGYFTTNAPLATTNWTIYGNGYGLTTSGTWVPSDMNLKTNIQEYNSDQAVAVLSALPLHTYEFNQAACPQMQMPVGTQVGILTQELEPVLPNLVRDAHQPAVYDSAGTLLNPGVDYKAMNMQGLIPYLVAGFQAQQQRIAQLEQQVAACCASGGMAPQGGVDGNTLRMGEEAVEGNARALSIQPNPFTDHTTLFYTLERSGRMQLLANSADGKQLRVLTQAQREAGQYQFEWNTTDLSPGVYYLTLLLDEVPLVKKAVRVKE